MRDARRAEMLDLDDARALDFLGQQELDVHLLAGGGDAGERRPRREVDPGGDTLDANRLAELPDDRLKSALHPGGSALEMDADGDRRRAGMGLVLAGDLAIA